MAEEAMQWGAAPEPQLLDDDDALRQSLRNYAPGARVLVADDHRDMREYLTRLLGPHWTVDPASDGTEALELARANPPDLVLADVMMPGLDGFALLRELRADEALRSIPVVLVTARAGEEEAIEGLLAGADDYIVKPFSARELVARVGGQLELARSRRRNEELNAFLVRFSDALRVQPDVESIEAYAVEMLAEHLRLDRCFLGRIHAEEGFSRVHPERIRGELPPVSGTYALDDFPETMRQLMTRPMVLDDVAADPRFGDAEHELLAGLRLGALLIAPLREGPRDVVWAMVAAMAAP